ncbi:hypothetical protein D3C80_1526210 [compost metagenome]
MFGDQRMVPAPGLQRGKTAGGVDSRQFGEFRAGNVFNLRAGRHQPLQAEVKRRSDLLVQVVQHQGLRHRKARLTQVF